uniref:Glutathione S-transferase omega n=1 Tax=Romanomermis culicivorax TaxID=13658 RepID=A0A915JUS5_ROMCU
IRNENYTLDGEAEVLNRSGISFALPTIVDAFQVKGFDAKAYQNGSDYPAYKNHSMRVYDPDPFNFQVSHSKSFHEKEDNKPDWFYEEISPLGKIPCVQYNAKAVCGSTLATEWLDDDFDHLNNLMPEDPYRRARQKMFLEQLEQALPAAHVYKALYYKVMDFRTFGSFESEAAKHEAWLKDLYYGGKEPGWIDYMVWPQLEKIELIPLVFKLMPPTDKFPKFSAYLRRMRSRPEVKALRRPARDHLKYALSMVRDRPDYDIGAL